MSLTSLLMAYYLVLRIRDYMREKPDPKLTYATRAQMDKLRAETLGMFSAFAEDLRALRREIADEARMHSKTCQRNLAQTRDMIARNAENISALIAQSASANQRISELSLKTDRIILKNGGEK